jgi:MFS family permease
VLAYADRLEVWHIFGASLIFGIVDAFFQPAYIATVPALVPEEDLPSSNSLTSMSTQAGRIIGPPLGALIIGMGGTSLAFALNALTFFISTACLLPALAIAPPATRETSPANFREELQEGLSVVIASPWLWISLIIFALTNVTLVGPFQIALPFLVKDHLHAGVETLGLIYAVFPVGYLLGGIWMGRQTRLRLRGVMMYAAIAVAGVMLGLFGLPLPVPLLLLAALINGAALEITGVIWTTTMQETVPNDKLGRVAGIDQLGSFGLLPVGLGVAGWATAHLGAPLVFLIGGSATALFCLLGLLHPKIRGMA